MLVPEDLTGLEDDQLYRALDDLVAYRRSDGCGRSPEAAHVRLYVREERERVKRELERRGLPATRPGDTRAYGPGQAPWQRASGA